MLSLFKKKREINVPQIIDELESAVFAQIKPYGFRRYGRTLHRFGSEDISQVIHFQAGLPSMGMQGLLCVNLGIRIPECSERVFQAVNQKKYYHEYECTIRSRLGSVSGGGENWYDLRKSTKKHMQSMIKEITEIVLPAFLVLDSRQAILAHRRDYPLLDCFSKTILLDECMIYGHLGDLRKARDAFDTYCRSAQEEYLDRTKNGQKHYLKKGQRVVYLGQDITAEKDGYVTLYGASRGHLDYLESLAEHLGFR